MKWAFVILVFLLIPNSAYACAENEYEQCWRIDLGPLGVAKDCKCLPKVGGTIGQAGEESKRTINNLARELGKTPEAIASCLSDVGKCAHEIMSAPLALPVQAYLDNLYRQAEGRTYPFSEEFIALAQPYYSVDLRGVTWANDINTGHGMTVAVCDRIFFSGHGNIWNDKDELHLVLHELEHTVQCQRRGIRTYLAEYVLKASMDIVRTGRINVHDIHDYEVSADAKADQLTPVLWQMIASGSTPIPADEEPVFSGNIPSQQQTPFPQTMIPVRYCQTPTFTCSIPPTMVPIGTPCTCNTPNGRIQGSAF